MKYILSLAALIVLFSCQESKPKTYTLAYTDAPTLLQSELEKSMARGKDVYADFCITCHMAEGKGVGSVFPPLAKSDWLKDKPVEETIHAVKYGLVGPIEVNGTTFNSRMTPLGLSDEEVADVLNYVMNNWGNTQKKMITEDQVSKVVK